MNLNDIKALYNDGDKEAGREALIAYLKATPDDAKAWAYLGAKNTDLEQRKYCYLKSLEFEPDNETIQARLDKLDEYDPVAPPELTAKKSVKGLKKGSATPAQTPPKKSNFLLVLGGLGGGVIFLCLCCFGFALVAPKPPPTPKPVAVATDSPILPTATPAYIITTNYNKWSFLVKQSEVISTPHGAGLVLVGDLVNGESSEDCWTESHWSLKNEILPFGLSADETLSNQLAVQYSAISPAADLNGVCVGAGETKTIILAFDVYPTASMSLEMYTSEAVTFTVDVANLPPPPPTATPDNSFSAKRMCQQFVEKQLKAPLTAQFGDEDSAQFIPMEQAKKALSEDTIKKLHNPNGVWVVKGYVDSANAFGTMLRADYSCVLDDNPDDDMWYALSVDIKSR